MEKNDLLEKLEKGARRRRVLLEQRKAAMFKFKEKLDEVDQEEKDVLAALDEIAKPLPLFPEDHQEKSPPAQVDHFFDPGPNLGQGENVDHLTPEGKKRNMKKGGKKSEQTKPN